MLKYLALAIILLPSPLIAAETQPATIALSATGTASVVPDMANLSFSVEKRANTAEAALAALREIGVADRDVQTSRFSVEPVVVYPNADPERPRRPNTRPDAAPRVVGYRVSNGLDVRLRDLDRLGTLLDRMVSLGINSVGGISFTNADLGPIREEARRDAVAKAIRRAEVLTAAAGVQLGRLLSIREGRTVGLPRPVAYEARAQTARAVPVARGENEVSITVQMEWAIEERSPQ